MKPVGLIALVSLLTSRTPPKCEDCRFSRPDRWLPLDLVCTHRSAREGGWYGWAKAMRAGDWFGCRITGTCGRAGRFFEKRDT